MSEENRRQEFSVDDILNEYRAMEAQPSVPQSQEPQDAETIWRPQDTPAPSARAPHVYAPGYADPQEDLDDYDDMPEQEPPRRRGLGVRRAAIAALAVLAVGMGGVFGYTYATRGIFRGVSAGSIAVGGMSLDQAVQAIETGAAPLLARGEIALDIGGQTYPIAIADVTDGVDAQASADAAWAIGHTGSAGERIRDALGALVQPKTAGLVVRINDSALDAALNAVAEQALTAPQPPAWEISGSNLILTMGKQGVDFDRTLVAEKVREKIEAMDFTPYTVDTEITQPPAPDLDAIAQEVNCEPVNATVDKADGKTIVPERDGVTLDPEQAKSIVGDGSQAQYTIPVTLTPSKVTAEVLGRALFRDTLAATSTSLNTGNVSRTNNVTLAAKYINGTILNPGDEFSYNQVVGERTAARGFQSAGAYSGGRVVDEVGGGVCQPSSTLYMAVLRADLKVTERSNHSFTVSYTPLGEDATVSWGSKDFRFVNSTDYPIKLVTERVGSKMKVTILGTKVDDKTVRLETEILSTKDWKTIEKQDSSLAPGTTKVDQTGTTGYNTVTYKYVTVGGETTKSVANKSYYSKRDKVVLVGPPKPQTQPADQPQGQSGTTDVQPTTPPAPSAPVAGTDPEG